MPWRGSALDCGKALEKLLSGNSPDSKAEGNAVETVELELTLSEAVEEELAAEAEMDDDVKAGSEDATETAEIVEGAGKVEEDSTDEYIEPKTEV